MLLYASRLFLQYFLIRVKEDSILFIETEGFNTKLKVNFYTKFLIKCGKLFLYDGLFDHYTEL